MKFHYVQRRKLDYLGLSTQECTAKLTCFRERIKNYKNTVDMFPSTENANKMLWTYSPVRTSRLNVFQG